MDNELGQSFVYQSKEEGGGGLDPPNSPLPAKLLQKYCLVLQIIVSPVHGPGFTPTQIKQHHIHKVT